MTAPCDQCLGPLYPVDILSGHTVCIECARRALKASRTTHPVAAPVAPPTQADEWAVFLAAVKRVAAEHGGEVDWTFIRPLLRGHVQHKHIGLFVRRARSRGLLVEIDHHRSEDHAGKNAGRLEPLYKLGAVA